MTAARVCDVAVVGAGPAGMAAATLAADLGLEVALVDEHGEADHLLLHQGLVPDVQLGGDAGCALRWDERSAHWAPTVDAWGASSVAKLFIAGDGAAIGGAATAEHRRRLAALAAATSLGRIDSAARDNAAQTHQAALAISLRGPRFLDTVYRPPIAFAPPTRNGPWRACLDATPRLMSNAGCCGSILAR